MSNLRSRKQAQENTDESMIFQHFELNGADTIDNKELKPKFSLKYDSNSSCLQQLSNTATNSISSQNRNLSHSQGILNPK